MTSVLELRHVTRTFSGPLTVPVLADVSFEVERGEYIAITGPSGSGKTTLLNILGLLDRPTSGAYVLNGRATCEMADAELSRLRARHIGFVFQAFHLLPHRDAVDNVSMAGLYMSVNRRERRKAARLALRSVGMEHRATFPVRFLSGGERQRVAIARAIVQTPAVVLCDEPTGNLDSRNTSAILKLLRSLAQQGHTVVVITHDSQVARSADSVLQLHDGTLMSSS